MFEFIQLINSESDKEIINLSMYIEKLWHSEPLDFITRAKLSCMNAFSTILGNWDFDIKRYCTRHITIVWYGFYFSVCKVL